MAPDVEAKGEAGSAGIELKAAALGRNRDPERVARKDELRRRAVELRRRRSRRLARPAFLARADNLHDRLRRREVSGGGDLFDQSFHIGAEEFR